MKATIISIIIAVLLVGGAVIFSSSTDTQIVNGNNVTVVDGKQIVSITARGGYQPRRSIAKAGLPTVVRFNTNGTFDCSAAVRIPSMAISKMLPQSGVTDIDIGIQEKGKLQGTCGMGMYPFEIEFKN